MLSEIQVCFCHSHVWKSLVSPKHLQEDISFKIFHNQNQVHLSCQLFPSEFPQMFFLFLRFLYIYLRESMSTSSKQRAEGEGEPDFRCSSSKSFILKPDKQLFTEHTILFPAPILVLLCCLYWAQFYSVCYVLDINIHKT